MLFRYHGYELTQDDCECLKAVIDHLKNARESDDNKLLEEKEHKWYSETVDLIEEITRIGISPESDCSEFYELEIDLLKRLLKIALLYERMLISSLCTERLVSLYKLLS